MSEIILDSMLRLDKISMTLVLLSFLLLTCFHTILSRIQVDTYAQMHTRVKLLGGDADADHTQAIGGDAVKLWGWIYLPILLRVSSPLVVRLNE